MLGLYLQAGLKKPGSITPVVLEGLQRAPVLWQTFMPRPKHYERYCQLVNWQAAEVHPFYWQVRGLALQLRLLAHQKSPFKLLGLVHLTNRVDLYKECRVDIPCELVARFGEIYQHRRGLVVEVILTGTQRGKRVYSATGRYLMRTAHQPAGLAAYTPQGEELSDAAQTLAQMSFSGAMVRRYARRSKDMNPIHLSTLTAKLFGFKRAIVHGMYSGACVISALNRQSALAGQAIDIAFKRPMFVPAQARLLVEEEAQGRRFALVSDGQPNEETYLTGRID
ncbi:MaoC family dehydratase [Alteromonas lipolytica]|uniref:MaoC-like domain-containing protein n=1 Tax=Alteromonas lipolytica TaxID=1856405 RepID=A0A1E8F9E1_9ALTE|nr:MaoC/PaaZ C-terminal domain-containing protein [Alteromonas lipolytica]OFI32520.1 hypothetical protein BFC17_04970 [Alteromonas lipolytica]GGF75500.1 hypothetical protein GCM10011338_29480 [Alteromonas lipolytica]